MTVDYSSSKLQNSIFFLGLATLFTHELDAMLNHEWRVLPLLSRLPDNTGKQVFLYAHIPLFAVLIALVSSRNRRMRLRAMAAISAFLVVHGILHLLFSTSPAYEFTSSSSIILIYGGAGFGAIYLMLRYRNRRGKMPAP